MNNSNNTNQLNDIPGHDIHQEMNLANTSNKDQLPHNEPTNQPEATPSPNKYPKIINNPYKTTRQDDQSVSTKGRPHVPNAENNSTSKFYSGNSSYPSTINTKTNPFTPINDGTVRMTITWKPKSIEQFKAVSENSELWEQEALSVLSELFKESTTHHPTLIPWTAKTTDNPKTITDIITEQTFHQYRTPKITRMETREQFIFGIRVCLASATPGPWMNHPHTQAIMNQHQLQINFSNAKSDSGDVIQAGIIFFKHPQFTQRNYYLMSLRRNLPSSTPFFDIIQKRTTTQGSQIPHLAVRCGRNHVDTLTEILSEYLNGGTNTIALFIGTKLLVSMSQEESQKLYETHQTFITDIQRLPLYPAVINIDRVRNEMDGDGQIIERSTRDWVYTLRGEDGEPMQCDVENGGEDRRAYLLTPTSRLSEAKQALAAYKANLRSQYAPTRNGNEDARPTEIYVPTAAVLRNLQLMQKMQTQSADIWRAAPASVFQSHNVKDRRPPYKDGIPKTGNLPNPDFPNETTTQTTGAPRKPAKLQNLSIHSDKFELDTHPARRRPSNDTTVGTTQSPLTRNTATNTQMTSAQHRKFDELEATFLKNHQEMTKTNNRMDILEDRLHRTMSACEKLSTQVATMDSRFTRMFEQLETIITTRIPINTHISTNVALHPPQSPSRTEEADTTDTLNSDNSMVLENDQSEGSQASHPSSTKVTSPEKKKLRKSHPIARTASDAPVPAQMISENNTDQTRVQYNTTRPSDEEEYG